MKGNGEAFYTNWTNTYVLKRRGPLGVIVRLSTRLLLVLRVLLRPRGLLLLLLLVPVASRCCIQCCTGWRLGPNQSRRTYMPKPTRP